MTRSRNPEEDAFRDFHVGDIISITSGRLVSPRHMDGIYDIIKYMTGDSLFTHQLPRVAEECEGPLGTQHPDLVEVEIPDGLDDPALFKSFIKTLEQRYGKTRPVKPLEVGQHTHVNPMEEACDMVGAENVIVFDSSRLNDPAAISEVTFLAEVERQGLNALLENLFPQED